MKIAYNITNQAILVVLDGVPTTVPAGAANFLALRTALLADDEKAVRANLTVRQSLSQLVCNRANFTMQGESIAFNGKPLPESLSKRINDMAAKGDDIECFFKFWERLQKNPSNRSVEQLWDFMAHCGIPLTPVGTFLAYKGVTAEFKDVHSQKFDNSVGQIHEMPRNEISDDPREACHKGFHVGALEYAGSFGPKVVICEVDPADVVCVPYDSSAQKMRVSKYVVKGHHSGALMSSTVETELGDDDEGEESDYCEGECEAGCGDCGPSEADFADTKYLKDWSFDDFMGMTIEDLRRMATHDLKIVGASKIPGGKLALVTRIMDVKG